MLNKNFFFFILVVVCCCFAQQLTDSEKKALDNTQLILNGIYESNKLPDPTTILDCFPPVYLEVGMNFINPMKISNVAQTIPVIREELTNNQCIRNNPEVLAGLRAFNMNSVDDLLATFEKAKSNPFPLLSEMSKLNALAASSNFREYGVEVSRFCHQYLPTLKL